MTTYNGHKNWNHWNVSLWINNDEGMYRTVQHALRTSGNRKLAATRLVRGGMLPAKTPDGAPFSESSVFAAMEGMET